MPRAAIVGVGRHGSGYAAAMLNAAGIDCGHESWWHPLRRTGEKPVDHLVDSSWCAVPDLLSSQFDGPIIMMVREPLGIISSLVHAPDWGPYLDMRHALVPKRETLLDFAVETWYRWTVACLRLPIHSFWNLDGPDGPPGYKEARDLADVLGVDCCDPGTVGVVNKHHEEAPVQLTDAHWELIDSAKDLF